MVGNPEDRFSHNEAQMSFHFSDNHLICSSHYDNTPMQYTVIVNDCKNSNFQMKNCDTFLIFAQNIDCGYTLKLRPHNLCFRAQIRKMMLTYVDPSFTI